MKKGIISVLVTFLSLATGYAGNLQVDNVSMEPGKTGDLKLSLSSVVGNYVGLQFDLTLPDGFSLENGADGNVYKLSANQADDIDISVQDLGGGTNRYVLYSNSLELLKKGDLLSFNLKASSSLPLGNYTISVGGIVFSDLDGTITKESEINATAIVTGAESIVVTVKSCACEYCEAIPKFEYTVKGGELEGMPEITCEATASSPVGTYDIVLAKGNVVSQNVTFVNGTLTITKAPLKIKAGSYTMKQGEDNPEFTLEYEGFKNNETEAVLTKMPKVTTKAKKDSPAGKYDVTVSGAEAQNYEITYVNGILTVISTKGDANGDGEVNVSDIVEIVNDIMGKTSSKFVRDSADMNNDGEINVTDIVKVVSVIMSAGNGARAKTPLQENTDNDFLVLDGNDDHTVSLALNNAGGYVASQFDVRLSGGTTLEGMMLNNGRSDSHLLTYSKTGDNLYRVVIYSPENHSYVGNEGELLNIKTSDSGDVEIDNILFITESQAEKRFSPLRTSTTGIQTVEATSESIDVYSLDGRQISTDGNLQQLPKGVYIINKKKVIMK